MIKDLKSYINKVGTRLGQAFAIEEFGTEEQLQFWELAAEHVSRKQIPLFSDIVGWMDLLYRAPVHFVYKTKNDKLILERRHIISENLLTKSDTNRLPHEQTPQEKTLISDFEHQLQNLEKKMEIDDVFLEHGISSHAIGQCEHIPLFKKNGDLWGIYCAGPYTKSPNQIVPKLSIVGRLLSNWLIRLEEEESNPNKEYKDKITSLTNNLGSGKLNTEALTNLSISYITHALNSDKGAVLEFTENGHVLLGSVGLNEEMIHQLNARGDQRLFSSSDVKVSITENGHSFFNKYDIIPELLEFNGTHHEGVVWYVKSENEPIYSVNDYLDEISQSIGRLLDYRYENRSFSNELMNTYYKMLRAIEKSRDKTRYHTPRLVAYVQRFGMFFGLDDEEMDIILKTARLHDIGYVGATSIEASKTIGAELNHPVIGANMIQQLAVEDEVIEGIKTHHEWVNGNGTPQGLKAEEINWSGKIIGVFEYVVDFVELHGNDSSKSDDEWLETLVRGLMERADIEFDMVIIPTVVQLIQALGWKGCVELGTE